MGRIGDFILARKAAKMGQSSPAADLGRMTDSEASYRSFDFHTKSPQQVDRTKEWDPNWRRGTSINPFSKG
jgi:hypothetical protein